jgi:hypothetical protein
MKEMSIVDALFKKYKHPTKMIHSLTSDNTKYSPSTLSHMIKTILKKYPLKNFRSNTRKALKVPEVLQVSPIPETKNTTKKQTSFFKRLFM